MLFNYLLGDSLSKNRGNRRDRFSRKGLLTFGIISNIALLGYFKYSDFFIENINLLLHEKMALLHLALPLAISFFTFQQISYLVDSYREETQTYDFLNYALFVTFFPQLIAGPIVHHKERMPQFAKRKNKILNHYNIAMGLSIFSMGLFKKGVIADTFATWATAGFDTATTLNLFEAWITSLSYTFQLYFDFSGYTDMAIGVALLFNIKLPINFNSPYRALNIQDFWRRWHITLSRFLRDYIYIPLGGNRKSSLRTYSNLMGTFIIGGLWHGAGWTFLFWGFLHGLALVTHRAWRNLGFKMPTLVAWFLTFNFINISWVFFRAKEWSDAIKVLDAMFSLDNIVLPKFLESKLSLLHQFGVEFGFFGFHIGAKLDTIIWIVAGFLIVLLFKSSTEQLEQFKPTKRGAILTGLMLLAGVVSLSRVSEFLYFNF
jgi:D-alanyl-lipoteichoic acid acyltransferase DltB (MBOAT superfamily)